jgi:hypothetical protein
MMLCALCCAPTSSARDSGSRWWRRLTAVGATPQPSAVSAAVCMCVTLSLAAWHPWCAVGLKTTSTIMFGHCEGPSHWARHLAALRDLQARALTASFGIALVNCLWFNNALDT